MLDAVRNVVVQHLLFYATQSGTNCGNLCHDIDTVAVAIDHTGEPTDLAFNAIETFEAGSFGLFLHP